MIYEGKKVEKLSIDLSGPQGNAFYLLAAARDLGKQLKKSDEEIKKIQDDMRSSDYAHLISVFDSHFGEVMDLYWGHSDLEEDEEDDYDNDYDEDDYDWDHNYDPEDEDLE